MNELSLKSRIRLINVYGQMHFSFKERYYMVRVSPPILIYILIAIENDINMKVFLALGFILIMFIIVWQAICYKDYRDFIKNRRFFYNKYSAYAKRMFYTLIIAQYGVIVILSLFLYVSK